MKNKLFLIILFSVILFSPAIFNFFSADDWFHLKISQIENFSQFINFFKFNSTPQSASFYRPLPTQLFFFVLQALAGLNASIYYVVSLFGFALSLFFVHRLSLFLLKDNDKALITTFVYGFSVTNFSRIYFLSAFQEITLVIFTLLTCIKYLERKFSWSLSFFILALMSKETAVVIPILLLGIDLINKKTNYKKLIPYLLILVIYLYLRFQIFGIIQTDTYVWNFAPKTALNTLMWYIIWTLGAPELFIDYISSGFRPIPRFFTDYPTYSYTILIGLSSTIFLLGLNFIKKFYNLNKLTIFTGFWFLVTLLPVLFLPQHKFSLELGLPLFGFAIFVSQITHKHKLGTLFLATFLVFNLFMNRLTYTRDYSVRRAVVSRQVYDYIQLKHPTISSKTDFIFKGEKYTLQVDHAISGSNMFQVFYNDHTLQVYYDHSKNIPPNIPLILIDASQFFD